MGKKKKNYNPLKEVLKHVLDKNESKLKNAILKIKGDSKKGVLSKAMHRCATDGNKEGLNMLLEACPEELKPDVLQELMRECVLNDDQEAISTLVASCSRLDNRAMFALTMKSFLLENNYEAVRKINTICPKEHKGNMLGYALAISIYESNDEKENLFKSICPDDLQKEMYKYALGTSVMGYNDKLSQKIYQTIPKEFKNEVLSHTLSACSLDIEPKKAFKTIFDCFSADITVDTFIDAMVQNAEINEPKNNTILMEGCPESIHLDNVILQALIKGAKKNNKGIPLSIQLAFSDNNNLLLWAFTEAMITFTTAGNEEALKTLDAGLTDEESMIIVYCSVMDEIVEDHNFDLEALKLIYKVCPKEIKVHMLAEGLVMCETNESIKERTAILRSLCPGDKEKDLFLRAILICIDDEDSEALEKIYKICPQGHREYSMNHALIYSIAQGYNDKLKKVKEVCIKEEIDVEVFAHVLVTFITDDNQEALARLKAEIPEGKEYSIYARAIVNTAQNGDEKTLTNLINSCPKDPKKLLDKIIVETIIISASENSPESLSLLKKVGSKYLKHNTIGTAMAICALNKNENAIKLIIEKCSTEVANDYAITMAIICIAYNDLKALKMLDKVCPDNLSSAVYPLALHNVFSQGEKKMEHIEMLFRFCPEDLKVEMFTNLYHGSAITSFSEGVLWVHQNCPESIKVEVLGRALAFSAITDSIDKPCLITQETFPKEIQQSVYTQAVEIAAQQYNSDAVRKLANAYNGSEEEKVQMYAKAIANCTYLRHKEALDFLINACPEDIKDNALTEATQIYEKKLLYNKFSHLLAMGTPIIEIRDNMRRNAAKVVKDREQTTATLKDKSPAAMKP